MSLTNTIMLIAESLEHIRYTWLSRVAHRMARGEVVRESFRQQLERFYSHLQQAVETGDPAWLDPALDDWVAARTESELEQVETSLSPILDEILQITFEVARESLSDAEALNLIEALLPVYTHASDYTNRKEMDFHFQHILGELEQAKNTLERLDESKSDFIAIAAHELKTPLTLIEGYTSMLRDQLPQKNGSGQADVLMKGIDKGTRRLREIVDDMVDVSMIDNNLLNLHFQPVWLNRLFQMIEQEFAETLLERNITLEVRPFPGSRELTFADSERLYQALRNVICNGIKYTPDQGRILVDGRTLPGFIEITVADTGIGIAPEDQTRIFEKFGRLGSVSLHSSGKTKFKGGGPGLGLPITKGIIEAHGGAIWVESDGCDEVQCPGAVFHILLPLRKEPPDDKMAKLFGSLAGIPEEDALEPVSEGATVEFG